MLRSVKELIGYRTLTKDELGGVVHDFLFDDVAWTIRYLVVDTGTWLPDRKVLIAPAALGKPDWETQLLPLHLTGEAVENSPDIDVHQPISRQQELELLEHYQWPIYWTDTSPGPTGLRGLRPEHSLEARKGAAIKEKDVDEEVAEQVIAGQQSGDPHLRSSGEVIDYHIQAVDGEIGHVEDFIADDESWMIHYMVVDTRNWLPGKKVLVSPRWISQVNWSESKVLVELTQEAVKDSPEYDPAAPINREYETRLYDYYGRPKYWL